MKRFLIPLALLAVLTLSACASQEISPVKRGEDYAKGTVVDATMHTLQIETADGTRYLFTSEGAEIDAGGDSIVIGGTATVYFEGTLDAGQDVQPVTVLRIAIE